MGTVHCCLFFSNEAMKGTDSRTCIPQEATNREATAVVVRRLKSHRVNIAPSGEAAIKTRCCLLARLEMLRPGDQLTEQWADGRQTRSTHSIQANSSSTAS